MENVENKAASILRDHNLLSPPIDPILIANKLGIKVVNAQFSDNKLSGLISKNQGKAVIYVNHKDSSLRKRFTIAHEIGHYLLHMNTDDGEFIDPKFNFRPDTPFEYSDSWTEARLKEWEANRFAAALLMDEDLIKESISEIKGEDELALKFIVSKQAMSIRLKTLGLT